MTRFARFSDTCHAAREFTQEIVRIAWDGIRWVATKGGTFLADVVIAVIAVAVVERWT